MSIEVSFYNEKHKDLLKVSSPKFKEIEEIITRGLQLDEDLWIYCLFKEQRDREGFRTYEDFKKRLGKRMGLLEDYLDMSSSTITAVDDNPEKGISEYVGVGAALKLMSEIYGLTEADWEIIPEGQEKDLDFYICFDGESIIEVECKGTLNRVSRSTMMGDIKDKKDAQVLKRSGHHILYGVITTFYSDKTKNAQVEILDPEPVYLYDDPYLARLINRLKYYLIHFNYFSRTHFLISLSERINILKNIQDYKALDNIPLVDRYGNTFDVPVSLDSKRPFKGEVNILGEIIKIDEDSWFFHGLDDDVISVIISQSYSKILSFKSSMVTLMVEVSQEYIKKHLPQEGDVPLMIKGYISKNSAGRYVGILKNIEKPIAFKSLVDKSVKKSQELKL